MTGKSASRASSWRWETDRPPLVGGFANGRLLADARDACVTCRIVHAH
jgi:hypothetical protein